MCTYISEMPVIIIIKQYIHNISSQAEKIVALGHASVDNTRKQTGQLEEQSK